MDNHTHQPNVGEDVTIHGELTIRGVTRKIKTTMQVKTTSENLSISGTMRIKHTDFGFQPYTGLFGITKNHDLVEIVVDLDLGVDEI